MGLIFLLDSNAVIDFLGAKYPATGINFINGVVDEIPNISVISKIEVLSYKANEEEYQLLKDFCSDALLLELNEDIINKTIEIRIEHKLKTPDAIIAATALVYNMVFVTRNIGDFNKIKGLTIVNPFELCFSIPMSKGAGLFCETHRINSVCA